jgi:very-short-patch-repair endonuclease
MSRQVKRGTRIFDFWCHEKWIAIEIDWWYHTEARKADKDRKYDFYNLNKHWILVIRIDNRDDIWAIDALRKVELSESWRSRKHSLWILGCIEKKSYKDKTFMDYIDDLA